MTKKKLLYIPNELRRNIGISAKVARVRRIKGKARVRRTALALPIFHSAQVPKGPSRGRRSTGDLGSVCLEEIDIVQRRVVVSSA
jgi:hypothetical protein